MADELSIGDVARRTGIPASTLRYYESLGILPEPGRAGGKRRYDERTLAVVEAIKQAKSLGFTLPEIRMLSQSFAGGHLTVGMWRELAERKIAKLERQIADARRMKEYLEQTLDCPAESPDECCCAARPFAS